MPTNPKTLNELFNKPFPRFDLNENFELRIIKRSDAKIYHDYIRHKKVIKWVPDPCVPKNVDDAERMLQSMRNYFNRRESIYWAIGKKSDGMMIGTCGIESWAWLHNRIELAYELAPDYWRQGIMTQALKTVMDFAYTHLEVNRIQAFVAPNNTPSFKLLTKLGFHEEAIMKQYRFYKGQFTDIHLFAHTKPESGGFMKKIKNIIT